MNQAELDAIAARYQRRTDAGLADRYSLLRPEVWQMLQERQRALLRVLAKRVGQLNEWRVTEVGCGAGGNLLELLRIGVLPAHLGGIELLPERYAQARAVLPEGVLLTLGNAAEADIAAGSQDLLLQATVFSSILDDDVQVALAAAMWRWLKPGGALLWYDFIVGNPRNPDVRGMPLKRVRELFPDARISWQRVTLAPPLARLVCRLHPSAYSLFNSIPWLRTHVLAVIEKPPIAPARHEP